MGDIYIFQDWTALNQVKNYLNPKRRARASVSPVDKSVIITIVEDHEILVRIKVNSAGVWSLTAQEAEDLLNSYGFNCQFKKTYEINDSAREVLRSLQKFGKEFVIRQVKPYGEVTAMVATKEGPDSVNLSTLVGWNYEDWLFMSPGVVYSINNLLE